MIKSLALMSLLAASPVSAEAPTDIWSVSHHPAPAQFAALFMQLPSEYQPGSPARLTIRSDSEKTADDAQAELTFFGPDDLKAPSTLVPGSPEELVLRFISALEAPQGYNDYFRGVRLAPPLPLTEMTLGDVMSWQVSAGARRNGYKPASVAVGNYQVITSTLAGVVRALNLDPGAPFDAGTQDKIGLHLLYARGFGDFLTGRVSIEAMGNALAREWAGLPMLDGPDAGKSAYWRDGVNRHLVSPAVFRAVLEEALALASMPHGQDRPPLIILSQEDR